MWILTFGNKSVKYKPLGLGLGNKIRAITEDPFSTESSTVGCGTAATVGFVKKSVLVE